MNSLKNSVRVGVGVVIRKGEQVLIGKRKGSHGADTWSFPGGHLEFGETIFETAIREVLEETGLEINNLQKMPYTNDFFEKDEKHYITLFVSASWKAGLPEIKEPTKCLEWRWVDKNNLPEPLFLPIVNLLKIEDL